MTAPATLQLQARPPWVRLRWPLPALVAGLAAWALLLALRSMGVVDGWALALASAAGAALALLADGRFRRGLVAAGFPLSAWALGATGGMPAWAWLAVLLPLALAYPLKAWRDAPFFPTPANALIGLDSVIALAPGARILDAGCGLGHGLRALHGVWPQAHLEGIEWSAPLRWLASWRCPWAQVRRADMWAVPWTGCDLVYVFQRPESMARAVAKASREMAPGSWLVSLEFEATGVPAFARLGGGARPVWVYRIGALNSPPAAQRRTTGSTGDGPGR